MKSKIKPIVSWSAWAVGLSLVMGFVTRNYILDGFRADQTGMSFVIALLFVLGLVASFRAARQLQSEWGVLDQVVKTKKLPKSDGKSGLADIFSKLAEYKRQGHTVDIHASIETYHAGHNSLVRSISIVAALLISMGLLGTIIGLIMAISGLGGMVENIGLSRITMMDALKTTVAGMGTAFYTTFFGALLGGVVLKVLGAEMKKSATQLVADTLRFSELFVVPQLSQNSSEALADLESKIVVLGGQLQQLGGSFSSVIDLIDSKQQALASGLGNLVARVAESNRQANERMETLVSVSTATAEETHRKADERLGALTSAIDKTTEETLRLADERLAALVSAIEKTTQETHRQANEHLIDLVDTVGQSIEQTRQQAEAQLDAKASDLAQKLNEAASVLAALAVPEEKPANESPGE